MLSCLCAPPFSTEPTTRSGSKNMLPDCLQRIHTPEVFGRAIASKFRGGARIEAKNGRREDGRKRCARPGNDFCSGSGSTDRTNQTASLARYHHHCELRGDLRSRWMGRHRGIWESEGGLAHRVAAA